MGANSLLVGANRLGADPLGAKRPVTKLLAATLNSRKVNHTKHEERSKKTSHADQKDT